MPQKKDAVVKSAVKTSFLCSVGFVLLAVMMNLSWETNDDFGISLVLANIENDYSPFQNKLLSQLISAIYHKAPILEWWLVFTLICIWAGLWALLYTVQRRFPRGLKWVASLVMICAVWSGALVSMNFTRTSMAVAIGGCVLIAQGIFEAKGKTVSVFECVIGNLLLILGGMIRTESALLALGFLAVIVGFELLFYNNFRMSFLWIRKHFGKFLILLLTAFLLIGSIAANNLFLTTEEKEFWQYNILRSKIQDYQECYPTWDDATEKYEAMGLSEGEQNLLIKNWFSEDTKVYSEEVMKQIANLYQRNNFWSQLLPIGIKIILSSSMTWVMLVSGLLFVSWNKKQNWLPFALGVSVTLVLSLAFLWLGRLPPRVYDSMALAALCTMMFLVSRKIPAEVRIKQDRLAWVT